MSGDSRIRISECMREDDGFTRIVKVSAESITIPQNKVHNASTDNLLASNQNTVKHVVGKQEVVVHTSKEERKTFEEEEKNERTKDASKELTDVVQELSQAAKNPRNKSKEDLFMKVGDLLPQLSVNYHSDECFTSVYQEVMRSGHFADRRSKTLRLEVLESSALKVGTILKMNSKGLIGSKRNAQDGCAYFGSYDGEDLLQMNDFVFPAEEKGLGKRHFSIEYSSKASEYLLRDLASSSGTFLKVATKMKLKGSMIVSLGSVYLLIAIHKKKSILASNKENNNNNL